MNDEVDVDDTLADPTIRGISVLADLNKTGVIGQVRHRTKILAVLSSISLFIFTYGFPPKSLITGPIAQVSYYISLLVLVFAIGVFYSTYRVAVYQEKLKEYEQDSKGRSVTEFFGDVDTLILTSIGLFVTTSERNVSVGVLWQLVFSKDSPIQDVLEQNASTPKAKNAIKKTRQIVFWILPIFFVLPLFEGIVQVMSVWSLVNVRSDGRGTVSEFISVASNADSITLFVMFFGLGCLGIVLGFFIAVFQERL